MPRSPWTSGPITIPIGTSATVIINAQVSSATVYILTGVAATAQVQVSPDGTTFFNLGAQLTAGAQGILALPESCLYVRVVGTVATGTFHVIGHTWT